MSDRPTFEDVLADWWNPVTIDTIRTATERGPIRSKDGTLVVHHTDPQLADLCREQAAYERGRDRGIVADAFDRAAALVAGDPKEEA